MAQLTIYTPLKQFFNFNVLHNQQSLENIVGKEKVYRYADIVEEKTMGTADAKLRANKTLMVVFEYHSKNRVYVYYQGDYSGKRIFVWVGHDKIPIALYTDSKEEFPNIFAFSHAFGQLHDTSLADDEKELIEINKIFSSHIEKHVEP